MILPRIAPFRNNSRVIPMTHMVLVDDLNYKAVCVRQPMRNGSLVASETTITCSSCKVRGWIYGLGNLSNTPTQRINGKWQSRDEESAARL